MKFLNEMLGAAAKSLAHVWICQRGAATIAWADPNLSAQPVQQGQVAAMSGAEVKEFVQSWAKVAGDGNQTTYYLAALPADAIMVELKLNNAALTGATSADLGLYRLNADGSVANTIAGATTGGALSTGADAGNLFQSAIDISSAHAIGSELNGLTSYTLANLNQKLWNALGFTDPKLADGVYVLGLRLNTAGSAAGALVVRGRWIQG